MNPSDTVQTIDPNKSIHFQEWKECRSSIGRFDKSIAELRKYGFSIITLLIGAQGLIYAKLIDQDKLNNGVLIGIYLTIMLLIFGLYRLDRMYHIFVKGAVNRSKFLEENFLDVNLSTEISAITEKCETARWGDFFYILFCIANYVLVSGALLNFTKIGDIGNAFRQNSFVFLMCTFIVLIAIGTISIFHNRTAKAAYSDYLKDSIQKTNN